jgi:hypothetical protein
LAVPSAGENGLGESQLTKASLLLLRVDVCVKEIFERGKLFPWPRPPDCPRCHGRIWGHGFVEAYFDGFAQALFLRRYRCPDCHLVLRLRPRDYWPRFQASMAAILTSLTHRLTFHRWPSFLSRQRQGHWLRSLIRKVRWHLGVGWEGNLLSAFEDLWDQGIVPVSRVI